MLCDVMLSTVCAALWIAGMVCALYDGKNKEAETMIKVSAFSFSGDKKFYHWRTGAEMLDFAGHAMIYFLDGEKMIFKTGLTKYGDRFWLAEGNKPKKGWCYADEGGEQMKKYTVIYRTGGRDRFKWNQCFDLMTIEEANQAAEQLRRMGYHSLIHRAEWLEKIGMPETYAPGDPIS